MTKTIPTTGTDERNDTFLEIALVLRADADLNARIESVLQDLVAAESFETMAVRSAERAHYHERDLVPVPAPVSALRRSRP